MTPEERQKRLRALGKGACRDEAGEQLQLEAVIINEENNFRKRRPSPASQDTGHKKLKSEDVPSRHPIASTVASHSQQMDGKSISTAIDLSDDSGYIKGASLTPEASLEESKSMTKPLRFREGAVMLTASDAHRKETWHVSLEELLDRHKLRRAVLAAFQIDLEWTLGKLNVGKTPIHIAFHAKDEPAKYSVNAGCKMLPKVYPIFPPMLNGANCMHSKLQLLFFNDYLRIVFPSANLVSYDWGEGGIMENVMYVQDLPRKRVVKEDDDTEDESEVSVDASNEFFTELTLFLTRAAYPQEIISDLREYDYSATSNIRFIGSTGGANYKEQIAHGGIVRLANAVKSMQVNMSSGEYTADYITASIGSLNKSFVSTFMRACSGRQMTLSKDTTTETQYKALKKDLKIIFPTRDCVLQSRAGSAGTICFQSSYYGKPEFPRESLYEHVAVRPGILSHCKMIICESKSGDGTGWAYVGSANFSASAWGDRLVKDRETKREKMTIRNWEVGVLVPLSMVKHRLPVRQSDLANRDPWFFMEQA